MASEPAPRVAVIGGGIAGVTAATALAERGVDTVLLEREAALGGRLAGWPTTLNDGTPVTMSRGFHAFFRQYYNLRALLRRAFPALEALTALADYPLVHRDGLADGFTGLPLAPPWNAAVLAARSPSFPTRELADVNVVAALQLLDVAVPDVYRRLDRVDAAEFLERVRFPASARHLAFEVFSRSFFADPRHLSAAELATMFHIYFLGSSEGLVFDVPTAPFPQALWHPLGAYMRGLGAQLRTATPVHAIAPGARRRFTVECADGGEDVDAVVVATDPQGLRELAAASPKLATPAWRAKADALRCAPPFLVSRLWLDRPVAARRPAFLATAGYPTLDNISVLERYEDEAGAWARRSGGSVVELHAYALPGSCRARVEHERLLAQLREVYPETAQARVLDERYEMRADCPLFPPGSFDERLTVTTPDPAVVVAGDHVRVDLPVALMERAATSGFLAANALLAGFGVAGHELWSVPNRGRVAAARGLARLLAP
ncbi:FAD-dependent oxidoreductase [Salinactinospora qingdaonensis]|uniref:FAD-dependent oxidoreductase n=1 Tax=Salinactinospora qingdaonensis TaxID=702744 RepID=A0ABP7GLV8_9ACTN